VCTLVEKACASRSSRPPARLPFQAFAFLILAALGGDASAIDLSRADALRIGKKVWQNECGGTISGLTSWNAGENFASLGIGHFIWYPKGVRGPFKESFPQFASFAADLRAKLPQVALANRDAGCPWNSRAEFLAASETAPMKELRKFLADTVDLQADFLVQRLERALPKMLSDAPTGDRENVQRQFDSVAMTPQGCYALVDYVNFKGEGLLDTERYRGQGWGLFQVLEGMKKNERGRAAAQEFAASAARVLKERVRNSPPERNESRWLPGWLQRVASYTH